MNKAGPVAYISPGTPIYRVSYKTPSGLRAARYTPATSEAEAVANLLHGNPGAINPVATKTKLVTK